MFAEKPVKTALVKHWITLKLGTTIQRICSQIPAWLRDTARQEVAKMLDLGVIEESASEWSSSIVLVPKPDHTVRF